MIYRTRGEHTNHYTTAGVDQLTHSTPAQMCQSYIIWYSLQEELGIGNQPTFCIIRGYLVILCIGFNKKLLSGMDFVLGFWIHFCNKKKLNKK
jgi:hypothetical protein